MKLESWTRYLVAAALVLLVGAAWVLAEEKTMRVEVRTEDGQEMTIDVNGVTEVIQLEDLADGEERIYDVGGHEVTVKRVGESLSLVHDGLIVQRPGLRDRRQRLLELTDAGRDLERHLSEDQRARIARAYREAGAEAVEGYRTVLRNLINERDRRRFEPGDAVVPLAARQKG